VLDDPVAVLVTGQEGLQDEELERAGKEIGGRVSESHQRLMGILQKEKRTLSTAINA